MAKNLVLTLASFLLTYVAPIAAADCELRLQSPETVYVRLIRAASQDGLLEPEDLENLNRGEIINPLANKTVRSSGIQLQQALALVYPHVAKTSELSDRLRGLASLKSVEQMERERAVQNTRGLFAPKQLQAFKTNLNNSSTNYFWYRDPSDRLLLAIQQTQDLKFRVLDPLKGKPILERAPVAQGKTPRVAQSPFFLKDGRLTTIFESPTERELVLYDVFADSELPVTSQFNPTEIQLIDRLGQHYAIATAKEGFEVFRIGSSLEPLQTILARNPMSDVHPLIGPDGRLKIVARDNKSVFIYDPLESREPIFSLNLGDQKSNEWISTLNAEIDSSGEVVLAALTTKPSGEVHLHLIRENQPPFMLSDLEAPENPRALALLFQRNVHGGLLLAVLDKHHLKLLDPAVDRPTARALAEGWVTAPQWLNPNTGTSNYLAFSLRNEDGSFKRTIVQVDDAQQTYKVAEFSDEGVGGEHQIRLPDGQWLYLATDYNRSVLTDGTARPKLVPPAVHVVNSSAPYEVSPGEYIVALNSGTHDRFNLRILRLTGFVSN